MANPATPARMPIGLIIAVLCLAGTTVSLQQTMVIPLLPGFQQLFGLSTDDVSWLVTATLVTSAVATPVVARLADSHGKRLMMLVCILVMTIGSLVAALSGGHFITLVIGRSLQGFAAALIPVGISILRDELPRERVGSAVALMSATLGIGGALGLPLGGLLFQQFGWPSVFWVSVVVGIAIGVAVLSVVPESAVKTRGRFDLLGAVMLSVALTSLLLAISKGGTWGWGSERTLLLLGLTVVVLAVWFPYSLRVSQPLVDLRTSARRPILLTNIASILVGFALMANILISTQQLQQPVAGSGFGLTAVGAGLAMIPSGLAMVAFSPVSGAMINRLGGRITLMAGTLIMGVGYIGRVFNTDTLRGPDRRLDGGQHRIGGRVRRHAQPDHGQRPDHRDRVGQWPQCVASGARHLHRQRGHRRPALPGHRSPWARSNCRPPPPSGTCSGSPRPRLWWPAASSGSYRSAPARPWCAASRPRSSSTAGSARAAIDPCPRRW